ncbi:hypothetical protein L3X38_005297 [Prunus dulcis]|uniref:Uncharacterized protein n=1 Tax=Prunus dulcis TaxID=3755 RepID=A0AAD4ZQL6_PRUDU|nr:hypothetical protein L3X38_005297 [Prunus dulcis]
MRKSWGALCAQYLDIGNTNQEKFKRGIYNGDYSLRSPNGRRYGDCQPGSSFSEGTRQGNSIGNCSGAGVARSIERQILPGSNRRSCPIMPGMVGIISGPARGVLWEDNIMDSLNLSKGIADVPSV